MADTLDISMGGATGLDDGDAAIPEGDIAPYQNMPAGDSDPQHMPGEWDDDPKSPSQPSARRDHGDDEETLLDDRTPRDDPSEREISEYPDDDGSGPRTPAKAKPEAEAESEAPTTLTSSQEMNVVRATRDLGFDRATAVELEKGGKLGPMLDRWDTHLLGNPAAPAAAPAAHNGSRPAANSSPQQPGVSGEQPSPTAGAGAAGYEPLKLDLDPETHDPEMVKMMNTVVDHINKSLEGVSGSVASVSNGFREMELQRIRTEFDDAISELDGLQELLGAGPSESLSERSPEFFHRVRLFEEADVYRTAYSQRGMNVPPMKELVARAASALYQKEIQDAQSSRSASNGQPARGADGRFTKSVTRPRGATQSAMRRDLSPEQRARMFARNFAAAHGGH